jgi:transcriptional regulator with XRE-family HTH domain
MVIIHTLGMAGMISSRQIKAARALLGWTQTELAKACGLHLNAINKIENGQGEPRPSTLERIKTACEVGGIRFRGQRGVELREDIFEASRYEGPDYMRRQIDDFLSCLRGPGDEALFYFLDEQEFIEADSPQIDRYFKEMYKRGFSERCITRKNARSFMNKDKKSYRWLPDNILGTMAYSVYGNHVAFAQVATRELLIIRNNSLAATFRGQFEFMWSQAKEFA